MGKNIGRLATASVSTDGGATWDSIGEVKTLGLSISHDLADATTNDSGGWKEEQYADSQLSFEMAGKYDGADVGILALLDAAHNKTQITMRMRPKTDSGVEKEWQFLANISDFKVDTSTGDIEDYSCSVRSTGTVTYQTQP